MNTFSLQVQVLKTKPKLLISLNFWMKLLSTDMSGNVDSVNTKWRRVIYVEVSDGDDVELGDVPCTVHIQAGTEEPYYEIELEVVPQGTLAERIRSAGAGIPGFYTATAVGTPLANGKESKMFDGKEYILEKALAADFAFVKAENADRYGNLSFNKTARNFNPIMCMAAKQTIVQVKNIIDITKTDPEKVVTPGIFVNKIVEVKNPIIETHAIENGEVYP